MSILILQLPARTRLSADVAGSEAGPPSAGAKEYAYVLTADGQTITRQGRAPAPMLPQADMVVAVMAPTDISWHRVTLPKAPAARLRAALAGMLEEALLDDPEDMHLALAPVARAGQPTWVAACNHTWLTSQLMALEKAKLRVERVVPAVWPDDPATGYFHEAQDMVGTDPEASGDVILTWSTTEGVASWPMSGGLSRALLPESLPAQARFFATPPVASPAERWLGRAITVQTQGEHLVQAARSLWNLLQFELTPRSKGLHALNDNWRRFMSPQWRPVRAGLIALAIAQVLGLNLWAYEQQRQVKVKRADMIQLLKQAHPQVQVVLDPPVQMQRETESLRTAAGQPGDSDLESLMSVVASAWPPEKPTAALRYDGTTLLVAPAAGWGLQDLEQLKTKLSASGVQVDIADGLLAVRRASRG